MYSFRRVLAPAVLAAAALAFACALHSSLACPMVTPPQPLRTLYKESARVVVARVAASEVVETADNSVFVRATLHVTENLKGEGDPVARLYYWGEKDASPETAQAITFSGRAAPPLKQGERFLFFLDPHEDRDDGYQVNDAGYGVKQLSDEALKVYLERLKELADITRREPEDKAALVEWLVRCAEEPATRWEGAYELLQSAVAAEPEDGEDESGGASEVSEEESAEGEDAEGEAGKEQKAAADGARPEAAAPNAAGVNQTPAADPSATPPPDANAQGSGEPSVEKMPVPSLPRLRETPGDASFVALLNPVQKQRLAGALFASEELGEGETALMHVVNEFEDPRFVPFVLGRLRRVEDEPPQEAEEWLVALAAALKNEKMVELAEAYVAAALYYDDEEEGQAEGAAEQPEAESAEEPENDEAPQVEAPEAPADPEAEAAREEAAYERATRKRAALLKAALTRIDYFVSTGQVASN